MKIYIYIINKQHMKNKVLFTLMICIASVSFSWAQTIPNYSFENWVVDTNYLDLTITNPVTLDTTISSNPQYWTTSNEVTNGRVFGHKTLVSQSGNFYVGASAIQLRSDSLSALLYGLPSPFPSPYPINFVCPGFAICGVFPINLASFVTIGATFNPALLPGAGIPVAARYSKIGGYMKYSPVGGDSAYVVAILRQGSTVVAKATYTRNTTDAGYTYFEAPFVYENCLLPDTLVYTLSSGDPYSISNVAFGNQSGLHIGSTLLVDSVFLGDSIIFGIAYPLNDSAHTHIYVPVTIGVLANDSSCDNGPLAIDTVGLPQHGTAVISGDSIIYTPTGSFIGMDTFIYGEKIGVGSTTTAEVVVNVSAWPAGIGQIGESRTSIYPNPASNKLYITTNNQSISELRIYDMLGNVMRSENISTGTSSIDLTGFSNGLYIVQFSSADGKMVNSSRFTVIK
jgi:hypothetical protein